jgi:hypothetical protein
MAASMASAVWNRVLVTVAARPVGRPPPPPPLDDDDALDEVAALDEEALCAEDDARDDELARDELDAAAAPPASPDDDCVGAPESPHAAPAASPMHSVAATRAARLPLARARFTRRIFIDRRARSKPHGSTADVESPSPDSEPPRRARAVGRRCVHRRGCRGRLLFRRRHDAARVGRGRRRVVVERDAREQR